MTGVRLILKDHQWARMEPHLPGKSSDPGRTGANNRLFVEAVLWLARTGSPWRDLPDVFGNWNSVFVRFSRWSKDGVWDRLFTTMAVKSRSQTPSLDQREKRTKTLFQLPKTSGRSRHGEPVRANQSTASTNSRLSAPVLPGSLLLP